jgi:hypothetical protein
MGRLPGKGRQEGFDIAALEFPWPLRCGDLDVHGLRQNVRVERDRDRPGLEEDPLGLSQAVLQLRDVVDDDAAVPELRLQLGHDVHAVRGNVLQGGHADGHGGIQRDDVDGRDIVEFGVGQPARPEFGGGARGREAPSDATGRQIISQRHEAGHVLAHGVHARHVIRGLRQVG